tara:strand:+ start:319 stop:423 length:105 start_codon:yes stop_codon:yes gene_type:complete
MIKALRKMLSEIKRSVIVNIAKRKPVGRPRKKKR